ncbi:MAG: ABC transporter substrate-binding protein [Promethearchaeota archaeon]|jgi:branched-chain amino acid transport system substrate-binding protein
MSIKKTHLICFVLVFSSILYPGFYYVKDFGNRFDFNTGDNISFKMFQSDIQIGSYLIPGITEAIPSNLIIKIGLIHDLNEVDGENSRNGLYLAAREVNEGGGVLINGSNYYVGLVAEDSNELSGTLLEATEAAGRLINHHPHFITGGQSYVYDYLELFMDNKIPFLSTGVFGPDLCDVVFENYDRYKYLFRTSPANIEFSAEQFGAYVIYLCDYLNITYGGVVNKVAILRQNSMWWAAVANSFKINLPTFGLNVVEEVSFDLNATENDFEACWNQIDSAGAQVVLTFLNPQLSQLGAMMSKKYQEVKPNCIPVIFGGLQEQYSYWDNAEGASQFEISYQASYNFSKTPLTIPFYTNYFNEFGEDPNWRSAASYNAVKLSAYTIQKTQSFDSDILVSELEKINTSNPFTSVEGLLAFTSIHDVEVFYPFGYGVLCQWKYIDGHKELVPFTWPLFPHGYPDNVSTGSLRLPYWGINGLLTDPPQPPGSFTMNSTARDPDLDGKLNLTWSNSEGANNYSIYMSDKSMNYISKSFQRFAYQKASSPFSMSLMQGDYYFRVVSYNKTGETMSNYVHVNVLGPGTFNLYCVADDPDTDGHFQLIWTESERADNYSVFRHNGKITSINDSLTLVANQTAISPLSISSLSNGKHYYVVVAHNELGFTLSNDDYVTIQLPFDMTAILVISIGSVAGVASIVLVRAYMKRHGRIKVRKVDTHKSSLEEKGKGGLEEAKSKGKIEDKHKK